MSNIDDDSEVLRDGQTLRVSIFAMDALQRSVRAHALHDGMGRPAGQRPGFVFLTTLDQTEHRAAYDEYEQFLANAWKRTGSDTPQAKSGNPADAYDQYVAQLSDAWRAK